jgi:hypothetical protein
MPEEREKPLSFLPQFVFGAYLPPTLARGGTRLAPRTMALRVVGLKRLGFKVGFALELVQNAILREEGN